MKDLSKLTVKELRGLARSLGLRGYSRLKKAELIALIARSTTDRESSRPQERVRSASNASAKTQLSKSEHPVGQTGSDTTKKSDSEPAKSGEVVTKDPLETLGELPYSYNEDMIYLLPASPELAHVFWDFSSSTWARIAFEKTLVLRVESKERVVHETTIDLFTRDYWVRFSGIERGPFRATIGLLKDGILQPILNSRPIKLPPNLPGKGPVVFARIEWSVPLTKVRGNLSTKEVKVRPGFLIKAADTTPYTRRWK